MEHPSAFVVASSVRSQPKEKAMKRAILIRFGMAASLVLGTPSFSAAWQTDPPPQCTAQQLEQIEDRLLQCLRSDCPGIRACAALTVKQLKESNPAYSFQRSIIPLMRIVKEEKCDRTSRIAASLALYTLRSSRGDFAIKRTGEFTDDESVKRACMRLSLAREMEKIASK